MLAADQVDTLASFPGFASVPRAELEWLAVRGDVRRVEPGGFTKFSALGVEEQRVWVIVEITSPRSEWASLGEAYRVNARFIRQAAADALRVPASATFRHGAGTAVFRIDG